MRRFGLGLRLLVTVLVLSGLLLGGLWLNQIYGRVMGGVLRFGFGMTFPAALVSMLSFVHLVVIITTRGAVTVSLGDEVRRGTLPDLLLTPLRRAEFLLAMGVGPARMAWLAALAGLPLYALLGQFGVLTLWDIVTLYLLACALGGLSPFALPVFQTAGQIALAGVATVVWAVGVWCWLPLNTAETPGAQFAPPLLLGGLPFLALSLPLPTLWGLAVLSPLTAWVRLFAGGPDLVARFPFWTLGTLPPFWGCVGGAFLTGVLLLAAAGRAEAGTQSGQERLVSPTLPSTRKRPYHRHGARTAALMGWVTAHTDNPALIYELRTRTRSGRWFDWMMSATVLFAGAVIVALAFPDFVTLLSALSPFHFFGDFSVWSNLAALLLLWQCTLLYFRGSIIGEGLIARDRQRGTWGFILLTLLTTRELFWGKVLGQTAGVWAVWSAAGLGSLLLCGLTAPSVGVGPALAAWGTGQVFVAAVFALGVGLGAVLSTFPSVLKSLRGIATLLFVGLVGLGVYGQYRILPFNLPDGWVLLTERLLLGSAYALILAGVFFVLAERRFSVLRRRDIAFGDGPK